MENRKILLTNPIQGQHEQGFRTCILGDGGKLYLKRGKLNMDFVSPKDTVEWAVPMGWNCPLGFDSDTHYNWTTNSDILAIRHYREYNNIQYKLKRRFDPIIRRQEHLYLLSKAINSNIKLPYIKNNFIPRPHQKVGIEYGKLTNGRFIIADQQRTGKSYTALLYILSQIWTTCLIVCPAKVVPIWTAMIETICDIPFKILKTNDSLSKGFNIVSYDSVHTIDNLNCDIVITDEAHFFIEDDARRSKAVNSIKANKKIALTGTPIMNNINNMMSIVNWVNPKLTNEFNTLIHGLRFEDIYTQSKILGEELKRKCLLLRETSQISTAKEPYINYIDLDVKLENPKSLQEIGKAKVNYAIEYCNAFEDKILVVFYHKQTGKMLKARMGDKAVIINGDSTDGEIEYAKKAFAEDKQILLGSSVLAEGLDFSFCSNILILEEPNYSMRTDQIRERCNRLNKEQEVTIDILRVPNSQDDRVYELMDNKYKLQHGLRDG